MPTTDDRPKPTAPSDPADEVRAATTAEVRSLARTLAVAFQDDPVVAWMFPDPVRRRVLLPGCFELDLRAALAQDGVDTVDGLHGAAVWFPPDAADGTDEGSPADQVGFVEAYLEAAEECREAVGELMSVIDQNDPSPPHHTLELLGIHPKQQNRGLGSALLVPGLARCDEEGVAAHLWSSNPRNVPFYGRHGFDVVCELALPDGPRIRQLWREPRRPRRPSRVG